jgi:putative sulfotransferase
MTAVAPGRTAQSGTFVVGTGRCGSTLLAKLCNLHPDLLSVSEFFLELDDPFPREPISGAALWRRMASSPTVIDVLLRHHVEPPEVLYPVDSGRRFNRSTGVPHVCCVTLPHLTDDPDELFDELGAFVTSLAPAPAPELYRATFGWLANRLGRRAWVERSGGSLATLPQFARGFPEARFVHLYRNGVDTALSMRQSALYRFAILRSDLRARLGYDPYDGHPPAGTPAVPDDLRAVLPETFDRESYLRMHIPLPRFGALWSRLMRSGLRVLSNLDPARVHHLSYEQLVTDPETELARLADFLGMTGADRWVAAAQPLVKAPRPRPPLPSADLRSLEAACRPGNRELARFGLAGRLD